jgi:hypothetical protein
VFDESKGSRDGWEKKRGLKMEGKKKLEKALTRKGGLGTEFGIHDSYNLTHGIV